MKRLLRLAALAALVALATMLAGIPAWAETTTYTPIGGSTDIVVKNLVIDSDANIPDITFEYTITRSEGTAATTSTLEILKSDVTANIDDVTFSNADTGGAISGLPTDADPTNPTSGKKYVQKTVHITFPSGSFTKPGVYRYYIDEGNGGKPGVTYDTARRWLDVFVIANSETNVLSVDSYVLRDSATSIGLDGTYTSSPGVKSPGFTNEITQYDFDFSKVITGNQGDKNKRFTFTLAISNAIPGTYPVTATDVTGNPTSITVESNGTYSGSFDLTNGSDFKVLGLNKDAVCTVSEDAKDYTPTHVVDTGSSVSGSSSGAITLADADHTVAFTNTRNGIIPTGVIIAVAPFAVGLVGFGAAAAVLASRKNQDEEE